MRGSVAGRSMGEGALHEAVGLKDWERHRAHAQHAVYVVSEELPGRSKS